MEISQRGDPFAEQDVGTSYTEGWFDGLRFSRRCFTARNRAFLLAVQGYDQAYIETEVQRQD